MLGKPSLTQSEIPAVDGEGNVNPAYPKDRRCASGGHITPVGTRFFHVSGAVMPKERVGVYCEHCLKVAADMSHLAKKGLRSTISPTDALIGQMDKARR